MRAGGSGGAVAGPGHTARIEPRCTVSRPSPSLATLPAPCVCRPDLRDHAWVFACLAGSFCLPEGGCGAASLSTPFASPVQKSLLADSQSGPSRPPDPCSVLPPSPGGRGPASRRPDRFTSASEPANIFSLSAPQFLNSNHTVCYGPGAWGGGRSGPVGRLFSYNKFCTAFPALPVAALGSLFYFSVCKRPRCWERGPS